AHATYWKYKKPRFQKKQFKNEWAARRINTDGSPSGKIHRRRWVGRAALGQTPEEVVVKK
ncbi:3547_t:CDS:2, partial [Racocetra persica]